VGAPSRGIGYRLDGVTYDLAEQTLATPPQVVPEVEAAAKKAGIKTDVDLGN
jgi:hypothetical protein